MIAAQCRSFRRQNYRLTLYKMIPPGSVNFHARDFNSNKKRLHCLKTINNIVSFKIIAIAFNSLYF